MMLNPLKSIEVKNYNIATGRSGMIRTIADQAKERSLHLPQGTVQKIKVDVTGQNVTRAEMNLIKTRIETKCGGIIRSENVEFFRQEKSVWPLVCSSFFLHTAASVNKN
jgi:hypothetical protein